MFLYSNSYEYSPSTGGWAGAAQVTPFYSNLYMPFNEANKLEITDLALNNLLIQRDDVSIYTPGGGIYQTRANPANLTHSTDISRNEFTEYNCGFDNQTTEGGDITFDGEAIEAVVVRRSSNRSNFFVWEDIAIIPISTGSLYTLNSIIYDPYVEHGIQYQYAVQPIGRAGRGAQYETLKNTANYDDIWLIGSDTQQLMMGYNPVVSGYKYIVKDAAIETIGSKYPYVVRNANVGYTQFQFSCTITAHMNIVGDKEVFTPFKDIQILDEYKDVIIPGASGGSNAGSSEDLDSWLTPTDDIKTLVTATQTDIYSADGRVIYTAKFGDEFTTLEFGLPTSVRKIEIPVGSLPEGVNPLDFLPIGIPASMWDGKTIIGYIKESDCKPVEIERPELEPDVPEGPPQFENTKPNPAIPSLSPMEIDFRVSSVGSPLERVDQAVKEIKAAKTANDEVGGSRGDLVVDNELQDPDSVFMLEREFRKRVMEFLYDGRPKIFKSPTEGLMLVKLTEISLTPNTTLGRMIYDFSCTMTEIGKIDSSSLARYGFRESLGDKPIVGAKPEEEVEMPEEEVAQLYDLFRFK